MRPSAVRTPVRDARALMRTAQCAVRHSGALGRARAKRTSAHGDCLIAFYSRQLLSAEINYTADEREVLAVVYAARHWRHYLHGAPFTVRTDNFVVQAFLTKPKLPPRQARWWRDLSEFSFTTEHIKGETNRVADALSQRPDHDQEQIQLSSISVTTVHHSVIDEFRTSCHHCPDYRDIHVTLQSGKTVPNYSLGDNGLVYWHGSQGTREPRICVPSTGQLRVRAVAEFHDQAAAGHMGFHKTLARVSRLYVWPKHKDFVKDYVAECPTCQEVNSANHLPYGLLQPLPIPEGHWQSISMDFIGPLRPPTPRGHDAILVVVDRFTKRARFVPCRYAISAREVADIMFDRVLRFSSPYHPQTDGQTEVTNKILGDILRKIVRDDQQWDLHLAHAEIAYNHAVLPATRMSPYYCDLDYHPCVPADFLRPSQMHPDTSCPTVDDWVAHMTSIMKTAHEQIAASQTHMAARANRSRMDHPFKVGDDVLIDARHLQLEVDKLRKFRRRFFGPCRILQAVGSDTASSLVSFRVKLPDYLRQARVHDVYHVSLLRPYRRPSERFAGRPYERPPPIMVDDHEEFLVSDIIGRRVTDDNLLTSSISILGVFNDAGVVDVGGTDNRVVIAAFIDQIAKVLGLLEEHNMTSSDPKSKHCMREATILGFVCNKKGRRPDVKKSDKILEWSVPFQSITNVRSFLGTCGFWRNFVKDFATKTEHLRKLVRQDQEWVWGEDQEKVVEGMKGEFKEGGLVLGAPSYEATEEKPFVVETDAGPTALGGVLIQADADGKERMLRFESRTLNTTERNYSQFKKETLAVLHCLRTFRNYIFGRRLILRVDPTALACSLKSYTPSDPTIVRWLTYIWMFNFELERIPGDKNRADGLSRINWDGTSQEAIEDTPPVDGFLDQEEDVRLHINEWSLRVPSCVTHPIWLAPRGYERKEELVLKPFQEEDPWGSRDVGWMMKLALAGTHSLAEEVRTIEACPNQVEEHEQLVGGMYLLTNTLLQGTFSQRSSTGPEESELLIPESQDDEFEEGEIREAFRAEEYARIYRELGCDFSKAVMQRGGRDTRPRQGPERVAGGDKHHEPPRREPTPEFEDDNIELFLDVNRDHATQRGWSVAERIHHLRGLGRFEEPVAQICEEALTWPDVEVGMQRLRASPRGRDGMPIRLEEGNVEEFIPAYEHYMLSQGIAREEWVQALLIWTRGAKRPVSKQIRERARDWEDCQAQLRRAFGGPERERHKPRVERRRRSKRPREPTLREAGLARERRRAPAQQEDEPAGPALAEESFPACGLRAVEFRRITSEELRSSSPLPSAQELDIPRETPFRSLATHLDVSQWEALRLGEGSVEPTRYVPLEEPLDPETETNRQDRQKPLDPEMEAEQPDPVRPQGKEVITVGDDTPPCSPVSEPAQHSWPEGILEPGSEEIPEFFPEATAMPEQEAEAEGQGVCERARVEAPLDLPSATHVTKSPVIEEPVPAELLPAVPCTNEGMGAEASTPEGQGLRVRRTPRETRKEKSARVRVRLDEIHARQAEMEAAGIEPTPPAEPKTSEQRIDELWARYESQRDAARQRSRERGQGDEGAGELREMGDLGFSATRQAIERMDRRICETEVTSFQWYNLLSNEVRVRELEVEHLTTQLAEERARSQAFGSPAPAPAHNRPKRKKYAVRLHSPRSRSRSIRLISPRSRS
ncbi:hypothetical protein CBR_g48287 [Chara braunii]|uniref:Integrase catalytic domain-containing protein n=1 Tax=Chara braunii TaxID=69332 RepID=A0A388K483_CHABU|nr:hypothetical protein CBR_g48287 [Chara braunii]|eukprot:GBG64819.1 hypothetical protein CBR_g48287 [Chara braunii]